MAPGDDGGDDGGGGTECSADTDVCLSLDGGDLNYDSGADIAGFQFLVDGALVNFTAGGDAIDSGFDVTIGENMIMGFSLEANFVATRADSVKVFPSAVKSMRFISVFFESWIFLVSAKDMSESKLPELL